MGGRWEVSGSRCKGGARKGWAGLMEVTESELRDGGGSM